MSEEGDYWRSIAMKTKDASGPAMKLTPVQSDKIPVEDWSKILYIIGTMMKKVSETVGTDFTLDIIDDSVDRECKMSKDGYHENMEVSYESTGKSPINCCIHCGAISKSTTKTKKEIQEHFKSLHNDLNSIY